MTTSHRNYKDLDDKVVLYPHNYINDLEGEKLEEMCEVFLGKGIRKFVVDFSDTEIINSIGISIIIGIIERVREERGVILFSGLKQVNHDIFKLIGLTNIIPVLSTEDDAVDEFKRAGGPKGP
jgi:anti-anti-sigma factor